MLVHICCSVDSHYFLEQIKKDFPDEKVIGFFYDPNIHPYSEYRLRFLDVQRSCKKLDVELIEGDYDYENWLCAVSGLEDEPEKGKRCSTCFDNRLAKSGEIAKELGEKSFTTTLLMSPLKSQNILKDIGEKVAEEYNLEFIFRDYRSGGGAERQAFAVKENNLYRQDYCGCIFALKQQRDKQDTLMDEMICPTTKQSLPSSIEERIDLYSKVGDDNIIVKEGFLNYRLLYGKVSIDGEAVPSYILFYSHSERERIKGKIEYVHNGVGYLNRESVKILPLQLFNSFANRNFKSVVDISISIEEDIYLRELIEDSKYSLSPLIILDSIPTGRVEIELKSKIYIDKREVLFKSLNRPEDM